MATFCLCIEVCNERDIEKGKRGKSQEKGIERKKEGKERRVSVKVI